MKNEELVLLYQQGDKKELEQLIENNKKLIYKIVNKFYVNETNSIDIEDLEQEGMIGLMIAAEKYKFNIENKAKFSTYAIYWIYGRITEFINKRNTNYETSLNTPITEEGEKELKDIIEYIDYEFENVEERIYIKELRRELEEVMKEILTLRERQILMFYYGWHTKECTFNYIGEIFNITSSRVRQIHLRALSKIRKSKWGKMRINKYTDDKFKSLEYCYRTVEEKIDFNRKYLA
ncbi:sigma-70 family RNA polymerase sigma factor [Clostridium botulinum]|uniref:Sigma-70 family RNA polymerase sigma factor n=1 Tax=Clostridium botulinum TaxID=1491 RepID=A0A6B4JPB9_CLOBO|nr:sigma-70 family RNA polymerase sigma factor [Clostridium botulinum]EES49450.1 RNA polymerase, sigma 32 subunit, RpoH [Clostridium botulinum E1 str. 'BoNT E Beluga']MBY6762307.1 sigma-70 family RNA polymerase sigma factor [Clostridium botulinum]MBY6921150.1 sigma-70 family RNA polymerase sigma factor [Clostridium botulinum]MCR1131993.1 sigma-70 family RNA polymerase sigma factor [Clostridium botulinum]NFJ58813.1 sigma-70 family RNA polymerase sigma factor [Clostridium botulinum]